MGVSFKMEHEIERDSCIMYRSFFESARGYDELTRLRIYEAIMNYMFYGVEEESEDPAVIMAMTLAGPVIKKSIVKYENGKKGGRPKKKEKSAKVRKKKDDAAPDEPCRGDKAEYGQYGNVRLSTEEYNILVNSVGKEDADKEIEIYDQYIQELPPSEKKKILEKEHFYVLNSGWPKERLLEDREKEKNKTEKVKNIRDGTNRNRFNAFPQKSYSSEEMKDLEDKLVEN